MELFLFWFGLAIVVGVAAGSRGRSGFAWFLLAVLISPVIAGLLVIALPNVNVERQLEELEREREIEIKNSRKCPYCAELVKIDAIVCKHCGLGLPPLPPSEDKAVISASGISRGRKMRSEVAGGFLVLLIIATVIGVIIGVIGLFSGAPGA